MMTSFDEREREFENRFAHEEELRFKVTVRSIALLGKWAAEAMLLRGTAAERYTSDLLDAGLTVHREGGLLEKLAADLATAGKPMADDQIRLEVAACEKLARQQIMSE